MMRFEPGVREPVPSGVESVVRGNAAFALDLYQTLRTAEGNLFFSPYSISTALAMTYAGARGNTGTQMARALHFPSDQTQLHPALASLEARLRAVHEKGGILLSLANALWPQAGYPFLEEYLALANEHYGVSMAPVDFRAAEAARGRINAWVEEKTQGKIKDLIPPGILDDLTRLVLTNAIYFKGSWARPFEEDVTEAAPFWVTPARPVDVPMMAQQDRFGYGVAGNLQLLELPYAGDDLAMLILLPRQVDGLGELETALTVENLERWAGAIRKTEVRVVLPRFTLSSGFELKNALAAMGMVDAFDENRANFSGMDGKEHWLYIAAVLHKAFVEVNEEGTEAAAATAVVVAARAVPLPPPVFRADHPFVFLIREKSTGSILFLGRVVNPVSRAA